MNTLATRSAVRRARLCARIAAAALMASVVAACSSLPNPFDRNANAEVTIPPPEEQKVDAGKIGGSNAIPVLVNDVPITRYDITQRTRLMAIAGVKGGEKAATDELINEALQMGEAQRRGLRVSAERINDAYAGIAGGLKMTPTQLTQALGGEGIDAATLKRRLEAQISWQQLVAARAQATGQVKASDVTEALLAKGDPTALTLKEYVLQQIVFVVPSGSSAGQYDQRRREAEAFRQRFQGCDKSLDQAKTLRGVVVKDIGRRDASQLGGSDGEAIRNTAAGKTTRPSQTPQGIEMIAVCSVREVQSAAAARVEVENQLFLKQSADLGKDYLKELRDHATIVYR
jgi:peptidyl-prolyl cis-trans isomerase SurA